uniref:Reverse transcriptase domain-containing protein n=1 Tax=Arundo donax TaxID=35708 RepID=A0A0A8ZDN4_ARUDO
MRISMYADDAAMFLNPDKEEIKAIQELLYIFGKASGLKTNLAKCAAYLIRCEGTNMNEIMQAFPCEIETFPCKYLGLPLNHRKLTRGEMQPVIGKIASKLPAWKGKLMNKAARLTLVNMVLSSIPVYHLTVFSLKKWAVKQIDIIRRNFLWKGSEHANGGHCLVNWKSVCRPKKLGGLGIRNLEFFSRALRLRWLWYEWTDPERPWVGTTSPCDAVDRQLF